MPNSGLALTAGASTVVGARINRGTARELARFCESHDCSQSSVIREFVSQLTKSPRTAELVKLAKGDSPDATKYRALLDLLGIDDPDTATTSTIQDAIKALLEANPPAGDAAGPEAADPLQAAPDPVPPKPGKPPTPAVAASKLSKNEQDYCAKHKLTQAAFLAKKAASVRHVSGKAPAPAPAPAPATPAVPRAFTREEIAFGERHRIPRNELRATLAERASKSTRRAT